MANEDDAYRRAAEIVFVQFQKLNESSLKMQGEYGKWLVSSLLFLHGAAIGGLLFKWSGGSAPPYLYALWWFVFGIVFALATGFSAWGNFTFAADLYNRWADVRMLTNRDHWPQPSTSCAIKATMWIAILTGVLSTICIVGGAAHVACTWR